MQALEGKSIEQLCEKIKHSTVGVSSVDALNQLGYSVFETVGIGFHATVEVPEGWTETAAANVAAAFESRPNPAKIGPGW